MRAKEIRERGDEDLVKMLDDIKGDLFRSRLKNATHQLDNTSSIRKNRREVARIKTIMNERRMSGGVAAGGDADAIEKENEE
jgi:large subunit ribosomal protein L29